MTETPERVWLGKDTLDDLAHDEKRATDIAYVRADLVDARVRETWDAAIAIVKKRGEVMHQGNLITALRTARDTEMQGKDGDK